MSVSRRWRRNLALIVCLAATPAAADESGAGAGRLPAPVETAARSLGLAPGEISFWVQPVDGGPPRVAFNPDTPRNPASVLKLVTTFAALEGLGPAYSWDTGIYLEPPDRNGRVAGDVWVRGGGDPYLVAEDFWKLADGLRHRGVISIGGDLVFDTSYYDLAPEDPGAFDGEPDRVYNMAPHPLLVNFNAVRVVLRPAPDGKSVAATAEPTLPNLELDNRLVPGDGPCRGYQRGVALTVAGQDRDRVRLEGRFPSGCDEYSLTRTALQPETYAAGLFDLYWRQLGGEWSGRWRTGAVPERFEEPFYVHRSRPLGDVVRLVNKYSNNVMTRQLELSMGAETFGPPATTRKGRDAMLALLASRDIDTEGLYITNSAGLSRDSRISARQLAAVLAAGWRSPYMPEFVSSLAIPGLDGTLRTRLGGTAAQGRMHMKTGRIDGVSAVAGYLLTRDGERLLLVLLINAPDAHRGIGEDLQDVALEWAATL